MGYKKAIFIIVAVAVIVCIGLTACSSSNLQSGIEQPYPSADVVNSDNGSKPSTDEDEPSDTLQPTTEPRGTTEVFNYRDQLKIEVTNVLEITEERGTNDMGEPYSYSVYICYPEAKATIVAAGMNDKALYEDGLPHPQYGLSMLPDDSRLKISEEMVGQSIDVSEIKGAFHLESSLYLLMFKIQEQ